MGVGVHQRPRKARMETSERANQPTDAKREKGGKKGGGRRKEEDSPPRTGCAVQINIIIKKKNPWSLGPGSLCLSLVLIQKLRYIEEPPTTPERKAAAPVQADFHAASCRLGRNRLFRGEVRWPRLQGSPRGPGDLAALDLEKKQQRSTSEDFRQSHLGNRHPNEGAGHGAHFQTVSQSPERV